MSIEDQEVKRDYYFIAIRFVKTFLIAWAVISVIVVGICAYKGMLNLPAFATGLQFASFAVFIIGFAFLLHAAGFRGTSIDRLGDLKLKKLDDDGHPVKGMSSLELFILGVTLSIVLYAVGDFLYRTV